MRCQSFLAAMDAFQERALFRIREVLMVSSFPKPDFSACLNLVCLYREKMSAAWIAAEGDAAMHSGLQSRFDLLHWIIDRQSGGEHFDCRTQAMLDAFYSVTLCTADSMQHNAINNAATSAPSTIDFINSRIKKPAVLRIVPNVNKLIDAFGNALQSDARKWIAKSIAHATLTRTNLVNLPWDVDKYGDSCGSFLPEAVQFQINVYVDLCAERNLLADSDLPAETDGSGPHRTTRTRSATLTCCGLEQTSRY
eukprot:gene3704-5054_t